MNTISKEDKIKHSFKQQLNKQKNKYETQLAERNREFEELKSRLEKLENPEKYKGSVADVSTIVRVAVTGRRQTPNLCEIMQVLGEDETISRIKEITNVVKMFI